VLKGINLTVMVGPAVPLPIPKDALDALESAEILTSAGETQSGFELRFRLSPRSPLHTAFLLSGGAIPPILRTLLVATVNGVPEVLMDGVVTRYEVLPGGDPAQSTLVIRGKDLTAVMSFIDFSGIPYPAMPPEARVLLIMAKYAFLGIIPLVIPTVLIDVPIPVERIPLHRGKDLDYIEQLAWEAGYTFYVEPGPAPGVSVGYWGPEVRVGVPQPALNVDMDAHTNVESMQFGFDNETGVQPILWLHNKLTKIPIPIPVPDISLLRPPLGLVPPLRRNIEPLTDIDGRSPIQVALLGLAEASRNADPVTATGTLDVLRYGRVLKARRLVGVRGAGQAFDGLYYVQSVTNRIQRGEFKQDFTLVRNGLISTVSRVPA
jgi:hypothetical protein